MRRAVYLILILFLFTTCSRQRAALFYFHKVVSYDKKATDIIRPYQRKILDAVDNRIMEGVWKPESLRQEFIRKFEMMIARLKMVPAFHQDTDLRNSTVEYLMIIHDYWNNEQKDIIRIMSKFPPLLTQDGDDINKLQMRIDSLSRIALQGFQQAQYRFANKFGFPLIMPGTQVP